MPTLHAEQALIEDAWVSGLRLTHADGTITTLETDVEPAPGDERHSALLPGMPNLHSHAFQRAMAGLAERRGPGQDTFWSWRTVMYDMALKLTPDETEAVAAMLYVEMLEAGFTRVGEFHYLHHQPDGRPYADPAEMAGRIAAAAAEAGIGLTLLPVFYAHFTFGGTPPSEGQRRFVNDLDGYARLMESATRHLAGLPGSVLGIAPHSLRAATPEEIGAIQSLAPSGPVHIHVAEQMREVEDCLAWSGQRPVDFLLDRQSVDDRWCLIHATHLTDTECQRLAASGAIAGLCPITEANLGDGTFPAGAFLANGGRFGIGSDSNVQIALGGELRQLEYSQRLLERSRNVIADAGQSTGERLFSEAVTGGARALGGAAGLSVGASADFVTLSLADCPWLKPSQILDSLVFAGGPTVDGVWVRGEKQVSGGRHRARAAITARFQAAMRRLTA